MASFNRVVLVGNLTRNPELRHIPSGLAVTDIGLAVNDRRKTASGEWTDEVTFVDITLWGRQAEIVSEYTTKGSPILIEGRLKLDTWETDGQKRSKLKVIGERIVLLGVGSGKGGDEGGGGYSRSSVSQSGVRSSSSYQQSPQQDYYDMPPEGDDVPF
jgi:single-strand DNA-binding protein